MNVSISEKNKKNIPFMLTSSILNETFDKKQCAANFSFLNKECLCIIDKKGLLLPIGSYLVESVFIDSFVAPFLSNGLDIIILKLIFFLEQNKSIATKISIILFSRKSWWMARLLNNFNWDLNTTAYSLIVFFLGNVLYVLK